MRERPFLLLTGSSPEKSGIRQEVGALCSGGKRFLLAPTAIGLTVQPPGFAQPLPSQYSFKTLLLLFKNKQDGREAASPALRHTFQDGGRWSGDRMDARAAFSWGLWSLFLPDALLEDLLTDYCTWLFGNQCAS